MAKPKMKSSQTYGCSALALLVLMASLVVSFMIPPVAPAVSTALIVGGVMAYRQSTDVTVRAVAVAAVAGGVVTILMVVLVGLALLPARIDSRISEEILTTPPLFEP